MRTFAEFSARKPLTVVREQVPSASVLLTVFKAVVAAAVVTQIAIFATTIYLHRAAAHKALAMRPSVVIFWKSILWLTTGMKAREWVAVHRRHHAHTDEPLDPHSPAQLGWVRVQLTNAALYRRVARDPETVSRYARDLAPGRADRLLFDRSFVGLGLGVVLMIAVLGPVGGLIASVLHMTFYLMLSGAVNAVGHTFGRRPFASSATNLQWLALMTAGEGLHNNHHAAPTAARFSMGRWEIDPAWLVIRGMRRLGLATVRHPEPSLAAARRSAI
jgi:stearoyl-CoA desaturase (delta-9 desaturase)